MITTVPGYVKRIFLIEWGGNQGEGDFKNLKEATPFLMQLCGEISFQPKDKASGKIQSSVSEQQ